MRRIIFLILSVSLTFGGSAFAQIKRGNVKSTKPETENENTHKNSVVEEERSFGQKDNESDVETSAEKNRDVLRSAEQMPQFPGGEAALMKYIKSHINYPPMAAENGIQGTVIVQFFVEQDGSIGKAKVARSLDKDLDREALRIVRTLPKFTPGRQNGRAVAVWYTVPVAFKLTNNT